MRQSPSFMKLGSGAIAVLGIVLASGACTVKSPSNVECAGENRQTIDCSTEVSSQSYKSSGGFDVMKLAQGQDGAGFEVKALQRIDEVTETFVTVQSRLCREYNACALDKAEYEAESKEVHEQLDQVILLVEKVKSAQSDEARAEALDALYRYAVPSEKRVEEVALRLALEADLPADVGGQRITVRPGAPLPTDARVWFWVEAMPEAYVYIFQKSARGDLSILFPDERIGTKNPLASESRARIPSGDLKFKVNDKDLGLEHIYLAASRKPLASLDEAFARVREGKTTNISQDKLLAGFDSLPAIGSMNRRCRGLELEKPIEDCTRTRGLELDVSAGFGEGSSIGAITEPGDGLVVYKFSFEHTTLAGYGQAAARYMAEKPKSRGGLIIDRASTKPKTRGGLIIDRSETKSGKPKKRGGLIID
jgi:Domain of unknown function (DUF4384)